MKHNQMRQVVFPILAAFIWGTAFVAQDMCADAIGAFTFNATRYSIAVLALLVVILIRDGVKKDKPVLSAEEKKSYTQQLTGSLEDLNAENEIETLVRAKGFADCLCFLQSGRADLTVMTSGEPLTAAQVAQIRDVVLSKSTVPAQNITVVEVK